MTVESHVLYECWAWLVKESDGHEGVIAVTLASDHPLHSQIGPLLTLQNAKRETAEYMKMFADMHAHATGKPVRLAHLKEVLE